MLVQVLGLGYDYWVLGPLGCGVWTSRGWSSRVPDFLRLAWPKLLTPGFCSGVKKTRGQYGSGYLTLCLARLGAAIMHWLCSAGPYG